MQLVNHVFNNKVASKVEIVGLHTVKIQRSNRRYHRKENCMKLMMGDNLPKTLEVIVYFSCMMLFAYLFFVIKLLFENEQRLCTFFEE